MKTLFQNNIKGAIIIEGHVQGLSNTRSLGEAGIPVYVIDINNCLARYSKYCKRFFRCPDYSSHSFILFLEELAIRENLQGWVLIPSNDHIVENISNNLDLIKKYYKTTIPEPKILNSIIDKNQLIDAAIIQNVPVPATVYYKNSDFNSKNLRFPVLIKGKKGLTFYKTMHAKAFQVNSVEELKKLLPEIVTKTGEGNIMIQELIPYDPKHKVVSFTAFCINGEIKTHWSGIKIREHPVKYGTATFARSITDDYFYNHSNLLLPKLKYTGVCEIEYLFDPRDNLYKLIEINPRTWLWVGLAKACGVNYALLLYKYLNEMPCDFPKNYKTNVGWINYITDTTYAFISFIKGQLGLKEYLISLKGKKINAVFSFKDLLPGIIFPFLLFYIAKKRG